MELKKFKLKNKKQTFIIIFSIFIGLILGYFLFGNSYAFYEEKKDFDVINGTVDDSGDIYFAYYIDGTISRSMPTQNTGYTLDETKSACDDESYESHEKGIYETTDYDGNPTYYYRESVENNYVKFAGFYWRIIRINSNGSIIMIYDGTSAHANGEASEDRMYDSQVQFQLEKNKAMYLGYMYTSGDVHGTGTSSNIKISNDTFYTNKLSSYAAKLDINTGFCGDRLTLSSNSGTGTGTVTTYNKGYLRVQDSTPTLACGNAKDYYTINNSTIGNKALVYPIGLLSADEAMYAGHAGGSFNGTYNHQKKNISSYLTTGTSFWLITPSGMYYSFGWNGFGTNVFGITSDGMVENHGVVNPSGGCGLKPVINIRSDVAITGSGTMTDPYIIN